MNSNTSNLEVPEGKVPPQSIEAEKSLLGSLMLDKNAIVKVADFLDTKDFYKKNHQEIYKVILNLYEKGEPIDLLSVSSKLKEQNKLEETDGHSYLTDLINTVPNALHVISYAKMVQHKRTLRDLIEASYDIGAMGHNETEDIEILVDRAEKRIFSITQKSLTQKFVSVKETLEKAFERIEMLCKNKGKVRGVPSGFPDLDNLLSGFQKSDLVILAARPSLGKSSLALSIVLHAALQAKVPIGIFSLESLILSLIV